MKNNKKSFRYILILIMAITLSIAFNSIPVKAAHDYPDYPEVHIETGYATHRARWYPEEPNIYVEVTLFVEVYTYPNYRSIYYSYVFEVGSVWCVSWIYEAETSLRYNTPEPGITTATVQRRFAYWFLFIPVVVDIKCQVHFDENTGLFYYSYWVHDNGDTIAQALWENFPWDSLYNG